MTNPTGTGHIHAHTRTTSLPAPRTAEQIMQSHADSILAAQVSKDADRAQRLLSTQPAKESA